MRIKGFLDHNKDLYQSWIIDNLHQQRLLGTIMRQVETQVEAIRDTFTWTFQRGCGNARQELEAVCNTVLAKMREKILSVMSNDLRLLISSNTLSCNMKEMFIFKSLSNNIYFGSRLR